MLFRILPKAIVLGQNKTETIFIILFDTKHCYTDISGFAGEGEGEVAFFSAKRWDRRNRADLIESTTPCHDAQVVGLYRDSNPLRLTILAAMSEDYTTAPQHLAGGNPDFYLHCFWIFCVHVQVSEYVMGRYFMVAMKLK